jgi:Cu-processing system permease protein
MKQIRVLAAKEFGDRLRSGWVLACALVWLGAIALTSLFGLVQIGRIGLQGYQRTVASLLNLAQYLVPLLGLLLGHDLLVGEREERTLSLVVAGGVPRRRVLLGKFLGGCLALGFPLALGFAIAGTVIGLSAKDRAFGPFLLLGSSGLTLGVIFVAVGTLISAVARTRVQALVFALLVWCAAVFAFDLIALGLVVTSHSTQAARQIEQATDATRVTSIARMHADFARANDSSSRILAQRTQKLTTWLALNPVDLFRALNLPKALNVTVRPWVLALSVFGWIAGALGCAQWKFNRTDL